MDKRSFIKIKTFFVSDDERNVKDLARIYNDSDRLKQSISELFDLSFLLQLKGKKVLIKPNWVMHSRFRNDELCLRTNNSILFAVLEVILQHQPNKVTVGDAPIQGCDWDNMLSEQFHQKIELLIQASGVPIIVKDFRRTTFNLHTSEMKSEISSNLNFITFNLGAGSYLEPISREVNSNFRVANYNPDLLTVNHKKGEHKYLITKELFDADVIINLPKIKTHQKTGITGALKNLVGLNGNKEYLPHHRFGGTGYGGDSYPGKNIIRHISEHLFDIAYPKPGKRNWRVQFYYFFSLVLWKLSFPERTHQLGAGWYGNDTCWRMVMDLNKIAVYGNVDSTLSETPQRTIYSLCDGIVGGEGNGPLKPRPLALGILSFTNNSIINDICMATLMGFNYKKIKLLLNSHDALKDINYSIIIDEKKVMLKDLLKYSIHTVPPPGWKNILNKTNMSYME